MNEKALTEEALIKAFLLEKVSRETILQRLGSDRLAEIEYQRDVLQRDIEWGLKSS